MADELHSQILTHLRSATYRPVKPRRLAHEMQLHEDEHYTGFRDALRELMQQGRVVLGARGAVMLPNQQEIRDAFVGTYRHNRRGFGFVVPTDPTTHEDLFIPEGNNGGAMTGDIVRAKITSRGQRDGKAVTSGRILDIIERSQSKFVGTITRQGGRWMLLPDGNAFTEPILCPDAAGKHVKPGTKVVIELTTYPGQDQPAQGVVVEVLGKEGEKDVDLRSVIVQFNLPGDFPEAARAQSRTAVAKFDPESERENRFDLTNEVICTIDPPDAKDYDDAISLRRLENGHWELGVHIADVSHFVPEGSDLDVEARKRGNSCYFPGHVIPMLPEVLSNGVCSLQEDVPRLCKSALIVFDKEAKPTKTRFANTIIRSRKRLRYVEAQAIIEGREVVPHPEGDRTIADYPPEVVELLGQMNDLARRIQKRRLAQGQIVLDLPEVDLVLDEQGKVIGVAEEDHSFTHTLIEMFMVEANEAVARLLDTIGVPFLRRVHPEPEVDGQEKLRHFVQIAGHKLPKTLDRAAIQSLLTHVRGQPEAFAINLAVLKSLTRAEYSPRKFGHYALASEHYCHFTSPIRRYADLTIHRLLDAYFEERGDGQGKKKNRKVELEGVPTFEDLLELGKQISFTERRAEDAERELRQVKLLELLQHHIGEEFAGVVTGIANFGLFIQLQLYLIDGLVRYENLLDDWWDVDDRGGVVRGQQSGRKIAIGDVCKVMVARVDVPRRELSLAVTEIQGRTSEPAPRPKGEKRGKAPHHKGAKAKRHEPRRGGGRGKPMRRDKRR